MSRQSRRRDASIHRKRKIDRPRLLKQAKTHAIMRPVAVGICAVSIGGAIAAALMSAVFVGVVVVMAGAMLAAALWWSSSLHCPACGTELETDGARGMFVPPATVTCTKCRVTGHPKSTLPRALQKDRPPPKRERKHAKRRAAVQRQAEGNAQASSSVAEVIDPPQ